VQGTNALLNNVTVDGVLDAGNTFIGARLTVSNGLVLKQAS